MQINIFWYIIKGVISRGKCTMGICLYRFFVDVQYYKTLICANICARVSEKEATIKICHTKVKRVFLRYFKCWWHDIEWLLFKMFSFLQNQLVPCALVLVGWLHSLAGSYGVIIVCTTRLWMFSHTDTARQAIAPAHFFLLTPLKLKGGQLLKTTIYLVILNWTGRNGKLSGESWSQEFGNKNDKEILCWIMYIWSTLLKM